MILKLHDSVTDGFNLLKNPQTPNCLLQCTKSYTSGSVSEECFVNRTETLHNFYCVLAWCEGVSERFKSS